MIMVLLEHLMSLILLLLQATCEFLSFLFQMTLGDLKSKVYLGFVLFP